MYPRCRAAGELIRTLVAPPDVWAFVIGLRALGALLERGLSVASAPDWPARVRHAIQLYVTKPQCAHIDDRVPSGFDSERSALEAGCREPRGRPPWQSSSRRRYIGPTSVTGMRPLRWMRITLMNSTDCSAPPSRVAAVVGWNTRAFRPL